MFLKTGLNYHENTQISKRVKHIDDKGLKSADDLILINPI